MAPGLKRAESFPEDRLAELLDQLNRAIEAEDEGKGIVTQVMADAKREYLLPHSLQRAQLEYAIFRHVGRSRRRFFPKGKIAKRRTGYVQRKFNPPSVDLQGQTDAEVLALALELGLYQYVRIQPPKAELNREAIHDHPEEAMALLGVGFHRVEELRVKVPAKRQSYAVRGRQCLATILGLKQEIHPS